MDESESIEKIIYFMINERKEQIQFSLNDNIEDIKELFLNAADANPNNYLKLCDSKGIIMSISNRLPSNTPDQRYHLYVYRMIMNETRSIVDGLMYEHNLLFDLKSFITRSSQLQLKEYDFHHSEITLSLLLERVSNLQSQFELIDYMTWLGFYKDLSELVTFKHFWKKKTSMKVPTDHGLCVSKNFLKLCSASNYVQIDLIKSFNFSNWVHTESSLLYYLRQIFIDLKFMETFNISSSVLENWLKNVYLNYNNVPYHSFKHGFIVTQMMYSMLSLFDLKENFSKLTQFALIVGALCHDLDHPGFNNNFLNNSRAVLSMRYNDRSPLENHHCSLTFQILNFPNCNIMSNLSRDDFKVVREYMIKCILATDMLYHEQILNKFKAIVKKFDFDDHENLEILMKILIKLADIGVECKSEEASYYWPLTLLQEFTNQADMEKMLNLPQSPYMVRESAYKKSAQFSFLTKVLLPLLNAVAELFPIVKSTLLVELQKNINAYKDVADALIP